MRFIENCYVLKGRWRCCSHPARCRFIMIAGIHIFWNL